MNKANHISNTSVSPFFKKKKKDSQFAKIISPWARNGEIYIISIKKSVGGEESHDEPTLEIPKEAQYQFDHDQQTSQDTSQQWEAKKTFHGSSNMHQEQYMAKVDIDVIKSYAQSYVSMIFALIIQFNYFTQQLISFCLCVKFDKKIQDLKTYSINNMLK